MALHQKNSAKRIIKKSMGSKGRASIEPKLRKEISGTFGFQARNDGPIRNQPKGGDAQVRCDGCGSIYFDKHWHSASFFEGGAVGALRKGQCEECRLGSKKEGGKVTGFAGEVVLEGVDDPALKKEIVALVRNVGKRAIARDPEDRIIAIVDRGDGAVVYTTENQLAVSIGKQVHAARKGGTLTITWSQQDKPVRVHWTAGR